MAILATQFLVNVGTPPTLGAAAVSDTAEVGNGHNTFAVYRNTDANVKTVTIDPVGNTEYGFALPNATFTLAAGNVTPTERWIPLRKSYQDDAGAGVGRTTLAVSGTGGVTGVTVAIVQVG